MKRFSEKAFMQTGIIQELKANIFTYDGEKFVFDFWDYEKGRYLFVFRWIADINKTKYEPIERLHIQLMWQHLSDYKRTKEFIYQKFTDIKAAKYNVEIRETGDVLAEFSTREEAEKRIKEYEQEDKAEGNYSDNYYALYLSDGSDIHEFIDF